MIKLVAKKIDEIKSDYKIFHPTPLQVEIFYDLAQLATKYLVIDEETFRLLTIRSIILTQQEFSLHHFEFDNSPPQLRMKYTQRISSNLKSILLELLQEDSDIPELNMFFDKTFKYYTDKYAGR